MHSLGHTRTSRQADHMLLTPDSFVRAPLPGMRNATAIVHATPAIGAAFTQYTVEFSAGGSMAPTAAQRFVYVLEGDVAFGKQTLAAEGYAYLPPGSQTPIFSAGNARAAVIEKAYVPVSVPSPVKEILAREPELKSQSLGDGLDVRILLPEDPSFDFAVNTMVYQPGAALPMVES